MTYSALVFYVCTPIPLCVILSEGRSPKSNPIEMSGANAMRARSAATQGSRDESDLSCQRNVTSCREGAPTLEGCNFPFGKLLVILRRSRFGACTSRFCLLDCLRLLSTRKSSATAYRVAICGGFAAFSEMTHKEDGRANIKN